MIFRHAMKGRTVLTAVAIAIGLVFTVAGCGGGGDDGGADKDKSSSAPVRSNDNAGKKKETESQASSRPALAEMKDGDVTLVVTSATREDGGFVTVSGTVTNGGSKFWVPEDWRGDESELSQNGASLAGASLVDNTGKKKYLVLRDTEGRCLCTKFDRGGIESGQTTNWFAQFPAPPAATTKVSFQVGSMPPASLELSEGE